MEHFEGHQETQTDLPEPLQDTALWNLGTWALPAKALSVASVAVLVIVLAFLLRSERMRQLFVLPFPALFAAGAAAALAWLVVLRCHHRPGRHWPRFWALILALLATVVATASYLAESEPLVHASSVAVLASVLALLPRLLRVRPDSPLVQRVTPYSLLMVLLLILPAAFYVGRTAVGTQERKLDQRILEIRRWISRLQEISRFDWPQMADGTEIASGHVEWLQQRDFSGVKRDLGLWKAAAVLGREDDLVQVSKGLIDAVVENLDRSPRLSSIREPAIRWDPAAREWEENAKFPRLSEITGEHHRQIDRLFGQATVEGAPVEQPGLVEIEAYSQEKRAGFGEAMGALAATWTDNWVIRRMPRHQSLIGKDRVALVDLLQATVLADADEGFVAADFWGLMNLSLGRARRLASGDASCQGAQYPAEVGGVEVEVFRLNCYSYSAADGGAGAVLRVELRLVYNVARPTRPLEAFFIFPLAPEDDADARKDEIMTDLDSAVRQVWFGDIRYNDRSASATGGFKLSDRGRVLTVLRAEVAPYLGDRSFVKVRAVW